MQVSRERGLKQCSMSPGKRRIPHKSRHPEHFTSNASPSTQVFAAVLSRSPSSDGISVLLGTMTRLMPPNSASDASQYEPQLLNGYTAEGHLRLVEVLVVPLSAEVVMSLWKTLDAVSTSHSCFEYLYLLSLVRVPSLSPTPIHNRVVLRTDQKIESCSCRCCYCT